jgi:predicted nucleotidyltransferase
MSAETTEIVRRCKTLLAQHYGARFGGLVLYGSMARAQAGTGNDVDLLELIKVPHDVFEELRCIVDLLYPLQLESEYLISAKPVSKEEFEQGRILLYRNAKREGVILSYPSPSK